LTASRIEGGFSAEFCDGENEDFLEGALCGTWASDILVNGTTEKSYTVEVKYEAGATDQYKLMTGGHVKEFSMDMAVAEKVKVNYAFVGMGSAFPVAAVSGATYVAAGTEPPLVTGNMALASSGLTVGDIMRASLKINNNLRVQGILGSFPASGIGYGTFECGGEIELYLSGGTSDHVTNYLTNTSFTLSFTIGSTTLKKTTFALGKVKLSDIMIAGEGNDQDVMVKASWIGVSADSSGTVLTVTRNVA
jgi:hypothetical protein